MHQKDRGERVSDEIELGELEFKKEDFDASHFPFLGDKIAMEGFIANTANAILKEKLKRLKIIVMPNKKQ